MSTRSFIGIENHDGTVRAIYCHWDGYVEHHGNILVNNYKTRESVEKLLALGDISSLHETPETCKVSPCYSEKDEKERLENAVWKNRREYVENAWDDSGVEFVYLYSFGQWLCAPCTNYDDKVFRPLDKIEVRKLLTAMYQRILDGYFGRN